MLNSSPHDWPNRRRGRGDPVIRTDFLVGETEGPISESIGQTVGIPASIVPKIDWLWEYDVATAITAEIPLMEYDVDNPKLSVGESVLVCGFLAPKDVFEGAPDHFGSPRLL